MIKGMIEGIWNLNAPTAVVGAVGIGSDVIADNITPADDVWGIAVKIVILVATLLKMWQDKKVKDASKSN